MKLTVIAVGQKVPLWAQTAWDDYSKRFPPEIRLELKAIKTEPRSVGKTAEQCMQSEAVRIKDAYPRGARRIVLDEHGQRWTTKTLAERLRQWGDDTQDVAWIIGGPDGLADSIRSDAHDCIRLSDLTLPHAFVRVMLVEALYRAWTVNIGHPYHRE
jgi:23S rRNA (pseudouridine1915-N3)-methyltransferase